MVLAVIVLGDGGLRPNTRNLVMEIGRRCGRIDQRRAFVFRPIPNPPGCNLDGLAAPIAQDQAVFMGKAFSGNEAIHDLGRLSQGRWPPREPHHRRAVPVGRNDGRSRGYPDRAEDRPVSGHADFRRAIVVIHIDVVDRQVCQSQRHPRRAVGYDGAVSRGI